MGNIRFPTLTSDSFSIGRFENPTKERQTINGQGYTALHFQTDAVSLRTGDLALGPASIWFNLLPRRQDGPQSSEPRRLDLQSDTLTVAVIERPGDGTYLPLIKLIPTQGWK